MTPPSLYIGEITWKTWLRRFDFEMDWPMRKYQTDSKKWLETISDTKWESLKCKRIISDNYKQQKDSQKEPTNFLGNEAEEQRSKITSKVWMNKVLGTSWQPCIPYPLQLPLLADQHIIWLPLNHPEKRKNEPFVVFPSDDKNNSHTISTNKAIVGCTPLQKLLSFSTRISSVVSEIITMTPAKNKLCSDVQVHL